MQKTVCIACLAHGCVRTVTPGAMTEKVREFIVGDFGPDVESLPQGMCQSCRMKLFRGTLKCSVNYQLLRKRGVFQCFHGQENHCECYICVMGRDTKLKAKPKGAPKPPPVTLMRPKGPRMTVNVGKLPEKPRPLSHQDLLNFKVKYGVSNQDTLDFAHDYRTLHGRGSVESFLGDFLVQQTELEASFLELTTIEINSGGELIQKVCVFAKDLQALIDHIKAARNINEEVCLIKLMGDTGGKFFKMSLATINLDRLRRLLAEGKARATYADGPFLVDNNDNGINALFIVAIVPKCKEDYKLVSQVIQLLKLQNLREQRWISGGDQKYVNLVCGVGEHSSTFPCSWCDLAASAFRDRPAYNLRTFGGIRRCNADRLAAHGRRAEPKYHLSVKEDPALPCEDKKRVIECVIPPELHFLLRAFNHIWDNLGKAWQRAINATENPAWQFAISVNAVPSTYHGQDFKGDACRRLLKSIDKLEAAVPPTMGPPFVKCLRDLDTVVVSCFSVAGPPPDYLAYLEAFYQSSSALPNVSFTPTLHGIVEHTRDFFEIWGTEFGLGLYGEQAGESVHFDFENRIYTHAYKRPECHPEFGPLLLRAVAHYNAIHLNTVPRSPPDEE